MRYNLRMAKKTLKLPVNDIALGDCIESMNSWPEDSVDLIFADPPYNIGYKYDHYEDKRDDHDYVQWTQDWIAGCARLLKPSGSFYILIGDEYAAETRMYLKQLEREKKLVMRNWIIWHYTFGQNCKIKFNRSHAHLFYCVGSDIFNCKNVTKNPPFTFNRLDIAIPSARQTTYNDKRANSTGKMPDDTSLIVCKNRLLKRAAADVGGWEGFDEFATGANCFMFVREDIPGSFKPLRALQKEKKKEGAEYDGSLTGGVCDNKFLTMDDIKALELRANGRCVHLRSGRTYHATLASAMPSTLARAQ